MGSGCSSSKAREKAQAAESVKSAEAEADANVALEILRSVPQAIRPELPEFGSVADKVFRQLVSEASMPSDICRILSASQDLGLPKPSEASLHLSQCVQQAALAGDAGNCRNNLQQAKHFQVPPDAEALVKELDVSQLSLIISTSDSVGNLIAWKSIAIQAVNNQVSSAVSSNNVLSPVQVLLSVPLDVRGELADFSRVAETVLERAYSEAALLDGLEGVLRAASNLNVTAPLGSIIELNRSFREALVREDEARYKSLACMARDYSVDAHEELTMDLDLRQLGIVQAVVVEFSVTSWREVADSTFLAAASDDLKLSVASGEAARCGALLEDLSKRNMSLANAQVMSDIASDILTLAASFHSTGMGNEGSRHTAPKLASFALECLPDSDLLLSKVPEELVGVATSFLIQWKRADQASAADEEWSAYSGDVSMEIEMHFAQWLAGQERESTDEVAGSPSAAHKTYFRIDAGSGCIRPRYSKDATPYIGCSVDFRMMTCREVDSTVKDDQAAKIVVLRRYLASGQTHPPVGSPHPWDIKQTSMARKKMSIAQHKLGPQSARGIETPANFDSLGDAHAIACFNEMLERERKLAGEWCCFYHSYSSPAFIYEVQGAIAHVLFKFGFEYGPLPRLLKRDFVDIPDAQAMLAAFPTWPDRDHNPAFKSVGVCVATSILSPDPEATPTQYFLRGYEVSKVTVTMVEKVLLECGLKDETDVDTAGLAAQIVELGHKYRMPQATGEAPQGHYLQIFIHRDQVDKWAYASLPYGVPDPSRTPLSAHMAGNGPIAGQARLTCNPSAFMRASAVRMFSYSAMAAFHHSRKDFVKELVDVLSPVLGNPAVRERAAAGVYGGKLPEWWTDIADK